MAKLIDEIEVDANEVDSLVEENVSEPVQAAPEVADLPPEYRNKTIDEIIKMHQEAVSKIGEQGNEVGQLRKVVDEYILSQSKNKAPEPAEEVDFFADPDKAVDSRIANHPAIKEAQQTNLRLKQEQARTALLNKHPDSAEILTNKEFSNWIQARKYRRELFIKANEQYDYEAADELFSDWKELKGASSSAIEAEKTARKDTIKKASTGGARASSESPSKKIYRRADIIELMKTDYNRYLSMEPEIRLAYAEKRVR